MAIEIVLPGGGIRVFEVRHKNARPGIQGVDDHLPVHGAGDFDAPIEQVARNRRHRPFGRADRRGVRQEIRHLARRRFPAAGRRAFAEAAAGVSSNFLASFVRKRAASSVRIVAWASLSGRVICTSSRWTGTMLLPPSFRFSVFGKFWILDFGFWIKKPRANKNRVLVFNPKSKIQNPKSPGYYIVAQAPVTCILRRPARTSRPIRTTRFDPLSKLGST